MKRFPTQSLSPSRRVYRRADGAVTGLVVLALVAVALLGIGLFFFLFSEPDSTTISPILAEVTEGEFVSRVLDQGEIQSSENVEIRCEVRASGGDVSVISVVPEGTRVEQGDFLVQLKSTSFERELEQQKIGVANAETAKIQSETSLATAKATLQEYVEGIFVQNQQTIQNEIYDAESLITTAEQELKQAEAVYEHSKKLYAKAFITRQTLDADAFAVQKAQIEVRKGKNSLELAQTKMKVLKKITFEKEKIQYESNITAARVKLTSDIDNFVIEKAKLDDIQDQIDKCTIRVPTGVSGQVVYAQESSRGRDDWVLEEGTTVRENQVLIRLPNPDKMEVKALINEQSITQIQANMPVSINVDALSNKTLKGIVTKVNQYAESNGWMSGNIRKYAVYIRIIDPPVALKPGMNTSVSIETQYRANVLLAPIQAIYGVQNQQFCLAKRGNNQWETLEVKVGGDNSQMVFIESGVEAGTQLVMNPGAYKEYMDLPEFEGDTRIVLPEDELEKIKQSSDAPPANPTASDEKSPRGEEAGRPNAGAAGGRPGLPDSGAAMVQAQDADGDGQVSKEEAGPWAGAFDRLDTDGNGQLSVAEADAMIQRIKTRQREGGGTPGGPGQRGPGGPGGAQ